MFFIAPLKTLFCGLGRAFSTLIEGFCSVELSFISWSLYVPSPGALKEKIILCTACSIMSSLLLLGQPLQPQGELLYRAVRSDCLNRAELPLLTGVWEEGQAVLLCSVSPAAPKGSSSTCTGQEAEAHLAEEVTPC